MEDQSARKLIIVCKPIGKISTGRPLRNMAAVMTEQNLSLYNGVKKKKK